MTVKTSAVAWKKKFIVFLKQKLQYVYHKGFMKDIQATGEASSPQKRTSSTAKQHGHFYPPSIDPDPAGQNPMRINADRNRDSNPQQC